MLSFDPIGDAPVSAIHNWALPYELSAGSLDYTHTLSSASLLHARRTDAGALEYTHTLSSANLLHAWVTSAGALAYQHTLSDADLLHGWLTAAGSLDYHHAIGDADLLHAWVLDAGPLDYAHTLSDADLRHGVTLYAESLDYTHTLSDADLRRTYVLDAGALTYTHTLSDADLIYTPVVTPPTPGWGVARSMAAWITGAYRHWVRPLLPTILPLPRSYWISAGPLRYQHTLWPVTHRIDYVQPPVPPPGAWRTFPRYIPPAERDPGGLYHHRVTQLEPLAYRHTLGNARLIVTRAYIVGPNVVMVTAPSMADVLGEQELLTMMALASDEEMGLWLLTHGDRLLGDDHA